IVPDIQALLSPFLFLTSFNCVFGHSRPPQPLAADAKIMYTEADRFAGRRDAAVRIAICDDEEALAALVEQLVRRWSGERGHPCLVRTFASGEELLFETAGSYPFDLILLDIDLGGGNLSGLELARKIRETDAGVALAFLTNYPGHVFEGYEVSALRYLMKPVSEENLFPLLDLVLERTGRASRYLVLEVDGEQRRVEEDCIFYLEARGHTVLLETASGPVTVKAALSTLSRRLGTDFVPTHRSFLVNLRHVERVGRAECLLEGGYSVPVSRGAWEKLNRAFIDYYREA
ncbi:MAG: LytTR family DNA-binding domain-containing protein, partial [Oscillospiraceae bacterium]|nr:LytTR family DNA-binding domain-containing protein [Oscillospiraceae bacterium]